MCGPNRISNFFPPPHPKKESLFSSSSYPLSCSTDCHNFSLALFFQMVWPVVFSLSGCLLLLWLLTASLCRAVCRARLMHTPFYPTERLKRLSVLRKRRRTQAASSASSSEKRMPPSATRCCCCWSSNRARAPNPLPLLHLDLYQTRLRDQGRQ